MDKPLRWYDDDHQCLLVHLTARSQVLTPLIVPLLVQRFVGEALKGTCVGRIRLWTLMVALLMQALMGLLSDRSTSRWGRRRPFILGGALGEVIAFVLIGAIAGLEGLTGYWVFFGVVILSMIASNATCGHPGDSFGPGAVGPTGSLLRFQGAARVAPTAGLHFVRYRQYGCCRQPLGRSHRNARCHSCLCCRDHGRPGTSSGRTVRSTRLATPDPTGPDDGPFHAGHPWGRASWHGC